MCRSKKYFYQLLKICSSFLASEPLRRGGKKIRVTTRSSEFSLVSICVEGLQAAGFTVPGNKSPSNVVSLCLSIVKCSVGRQFDVDRSLIALLIFHRMRCRARAWGINEAYLQLSAGDEIEKRYSNTDSLKGYWNIRLMGLIILL